MNVGANKVQATGGVWRGKDTAASAWISSGCLGTTTPEFHPGFAGDTVVQTNDLSGVGQSACAGDLVPSA